MSMLFKLNEMKLKNFEFSSIWPTFKEYWRKRFCFYLVKIKSTYTLRNGLEALWHPYKSNIWNFVKFLHSPKLAETH